MKAKMIITGMVLTLLLTESAQAFSWGNLGKMIGTCLKNSGRAVPSLANTPQGLKATGIIPKSLAPLEGKAVKEAEGFLQAVRPECDLGRLKEIGNPQGKMQTDPGAMFGHTKEKSFFEGTGEGVFKFKPDWQKKKSQQVGEFEWDYAFPIASSFSRSYQDWRHAEEEREKNAKEQGLHIKLNNP